VPAIEFWGWRTKDIDAITDTVRSTGVTITSFLADPPGRLVDPRTHAEFLQTLSESCRRAVDLESASLIVLAGDRLPDVSEADQRQSLVDVLGQAVEVAALYDVTLVLEPLNTRVDHPTYFLASTIDALAIVREIDNPHLKLLYDVYHSVTMGEDVAAVIENAGPLIGHVHFADAPGRHEPGTGQVDWQETLDAIARCGYEGAIGLEYTPTGDSTESLKLIREALRRQGNTTISKPPQPLSRLEERISQ
jgi:hydroxypyruvate isomerase